MMGESSCEVARGTTGQLGTSMLLDDLSAQTIAPDETNTLTGISDIREMTSRLYEETRMSLHRYLRGLGMNGDIEDVLQEAFLRLLRELRRSAKIENPQAWVFQVAYNLSMDTHRANRRITSNMGEECNPEYQVADCRSNPEWLFLQRERLRCVCKAFSQLTPRQYRSVQLRVRGLRYRDIAADLAVSEQRAMILVKRALVRLDQSA